METRKEFAMTRSKPGQCLVAAGLTLLPAVGFAAETGGSANPWPTHFVTGPLLIVLAIGMVLLFISWREKRKLDLIARFVDKGQEIPPALLPQPPSPLREIRRGIWFTSLGIGWFLVLYLATDDARTSAAWSVILLFLGAASFINAALLRQPSDPRK
jgi:hypothetical protein